MGRPVLVDLSEPNNPEAHLIVCRTCHTHLARRQDIVNSFPDGNLAFSNMVNVKVDDPAEREQIDNHRTLADVRCITCRNQLGLKFLRDEIPVLLPGVRSNLGQYHLLKEKLAQWKSGQRYWNVAAGDFEP